MTYKNLGVRLPKCRVATGLYSHWDSIIKVNKNILDWITNSSKSKPKDIVLDSLKEVFYALNKAIENGDREFLISESVYKKLNSFFPKRKFRLGGNGNNMGSTLYYLGLDPLVSYPMRPEKLMKRSPNFKVAVGNELGIPRDAIREGDKGYDHIVFESKEWRCILSWDIMSSQGIFDNDFLKMASNNRFIDILILAYAHLLLPKYKKRTDVVIDNLKSRRPRVHLEFGLGCEDSMKYAMKKFSEYNCCDSWGLNEKECMVYLKAKSESKEDLKEAALKAVKEYNLKRICVHSKDFTFSVSKYNIKKELESLSTASLVAAAKTFGKFDIKNMRLLHSNGSLIKEKIGGYNFCLIPNLINPSPKILTGVGDTFSAVQAVKILATQTSLLKLF
jgi:ADP-dependent phosphofructokinase/glucokinase